MFSNNYEFYVTPKGWNIVLFLCWDQKILWALAYLQ